MRARPNADLATARLVDSGNLTDTDRVSTIGAEAMYFQGPFKAQAEYYTSKAKRYDHDNYTSDGYYISGVWNVTGETWSYKGGTPGTGLPNNPVGGQWQLGVRYDHMDLNDGNLAANPVAGRPPIVDGVLGGKMDIWTVGANWYLRSNFKLMLNYVMVDSKYSSTARGFVNDDPNILEARAQFFW